MVCKIQSRSNQKVKDLIKNKDDYFFFEGEKLVNDILERNIDIDVLIINENKENTFNTPGKAKINETWLVSESILEKLSSLKEKPDIIAALKLKEKPIDFKKSKVVIALDNIQDPANAGVIFRCAAAFGVDSIAFTGSGVKKNNPKLLRAAQNSIFDIHTQHYDCAESLVKSAEKAGFNIYLTSSHSPNNSITPKEIQKPCLILFGNEGKGLDEFLFTQYPSVTIPQTNKVESLNVGASACIIMSNLPF
jgi:RNA methyltransferase, TrmH family